MSDRNPNIDFLKFIGISCIILAHVDTPRIIFQARNFDVPLMVLLSGISFSQFSSRKFSSFSKYLYSRFLRLIVPTWIFLILYHSIDYFCYSDIPDIQNVYKQFFLIGDAGTGIWIIRIFVSMALIAPFLMKINKNIDTNKKFILTVVAALIVHEILLFYSKQIMPDTVFNLFRTGLFFTYPYGLIFLYGIRLPVFNIKTIQSHIWISGTIFLLIFGYLFLTNREIIPTQQFKYPPQTYYLSYALFISLSLFYMMTKLSKPNIGNIKIFQFIGHSTLWIYLWHLLLIKIYGYLDIIMYFLFEYLLIYAFTILFVFLQTRIVFWVATNFLPEKNKKILTKIFIG